MRARLASLLRARRREPQERLFPRLRMVEERLPALRQAYEPLGHAPDERLAMLEAKVEYLLDELYRLKSQMRSLLPQSAAIAGLRRYQVESFDYEWRHLPYHDEFLSNEAWRERAGDDVAARCGVDKEWFRGKRVLDCGCGPGRHSWAFASLGAAVTAFDMAEGGLAAARAACADFPAVTIERRDILEPLPYPPDYDLVWCYGVVHHTGDARRALENIARHAKPGGLFYVMVYAEPRRSNLHDYTYYHEIAAIRDAVRGLSFTEKAEILKQIEGERQALAWFDAISSEINELFTFEELSAMVGGLGFTDIRRTMPHETMHNLVARRIGGGPRAQ
jgi:SAM-dependent methyltransferase